LSFLDFFVPFKLLEQTFQSDLLQFLGSLLSACLVFPSSTFQQPALFQACQSGGFLHMMIDSLREIELMPTRRTGDGHLTIGWTHNLFPFIMFSIAHMGWRLDQ
jgi:hypothetical protein